MQPTFLPWLGYFAMMDRVDEFVFLDHVDFNKRSWQQRNQIKTVNGPQWLTVPVNASQGQAINEIKIASPLDKLIRAIEYNYSKAPYYDDTLIKILRYPIDHLVWLNVELIYWITTKLGITTPLTFSSMFEPEGSKADLLVDICRKRGAREYISSPGSRDYIEESGAFEIPVTYFEYNHPVYNQPGEFLPYMSAIDLLFNEGPKSLEIIRSGCHSGARGLPQNTGQEHQVFQGQAYHRLHDRGSAKIGRL